MSKRCWRGDRGHCVWCIILPSQFLENFWQKTDSFWIQAHSTASHRFITSKWSWQNKDIYCILQQKQLAHGYLFSRGLMAYINTSSTTRFPGFKVYLMTPQLQVLTFGFAKAPRLFTKLSKAAASILSEHEVNILMYIHRGLVEHSCLQD